MGYTHYWYRPRNITLGAVAADLGKLVPGLAEAGVLLAGPHGVGAAVIAPDLIAFNGRESCGHVQRNLGVAWPARDASGVRSGGAVAGTWFAGASLMARTCDGDCSHESFVLEPTFQGYEQTDKLGRFFAFCKTAYKPYDLAVTAALIVARHHLGDALGVASDGESRDWQDARRLCQHVLGYGKDFELRDDS